MAGTVFPALIKLEHQPGTAAQTFLREVEGALRPAEERFKEFSGEARRALEQALATPRSAGGSLNLGVAEMRAAALAADKRAVAARDLAFATQLAAKAEGDYSESARTAIAATQAQAREAEAAARAAHSHAAAIEQVQAQITRFTSTARIVTSEYLALAQAEIAAANGARMVDAINASTGLDRTARSARDAAAAFDLLFQAQDARSAAAGQAFFNTALGIDATTKSARESARAFEELFARQDAVAAASREMERSAADLRSQLDPMYAAQQRFDTELARADQLLEAGAISTREYAAAQQLARDNLREAAVAATSSNEAVTRATQRGTEANRMMVNSSRSVRLAMVQSGQQLQDVAISLYSGQRASVVFAQQLPQLAFALTSLEDSANKTHQRVGRLATYLSGPWGLVWGLAAGVVVTLIADLLNFGEAADDAKGKSFDLSHALDTTSLSAKDAASAMEQLEQATRNAISAQGDYLTVQGQTARTAVADLEKKLAAQRAQLEGLQSLSNTSVATRVTDLALGTTAGVRSGIAETEAALASARQAVINSEIAESQRRVNESLDAGTAAAGRYARAIGELEDRFRQSQADPIGAQSDGIFISQQGYEREYRRLTQLKKAAEEAARATGRRGGASASAQASLGDMVALVKELFPGASITSTNGGRHAKGSDHYAGRAIDFVPAGGMAQYSTAEVEQILRDAGVDIRRNAKGIEQMFGPGRSAGKPGDHDDHFHFAWQGAAPDPEKVRAALAKAQQAMQEYAQRSGESIARINERFDEQPRLIDQAAQATRQLDAIIADLSEKKPPNFEALIDQAEAAKAAVEDALVRPFRELAEESERRLEIEELLTFGREREAAVLQEIWRMEERIGDLTADQKADVADIVGYEYDRIEALRRVQEMQSAYLDATRQIRGELESFFAGDGANFGRIAKQLSARITVETLFGDALREIEQSVKSGFDRSVDFYKDETERAGQAALTFADTVNEASRRISDPAYADFTRSFDTTFGSTSVTAAQAAANDNYDGEIIVNGRRVANGVGGMSPAAYAELVGAKLAAPMIASIEQAFGITLPTQLRGIMGGAAGGYAVGGAAGGVLGLGKGLLSEFGGKFFSHEQLTDMFQGLDKGIAGAQTGTMAAGLMKSLGIKTSTTGAQIGGAIGGMLPIPGGQIIGSIAGGLIGGLFKSSRSASAVLTGGGGYSLAGSDSKRYGAADDLGGAVMSALSRLADELGAEIGSFFVNIGTRGGDFRVNPNSQSLKTKNGAINFGDDQAAAIAYAVANAVADGAIKGLGAAEQRLLQANDDIEAALKDVLDFRSVAKRLKQYKDPVGAALDELDAEFEHLKDVFERAGASAAEYAQLEELYGIERAKAIKAATESVSGALKDLLDFLTIGDSGLSLRDRESAARGQYDALATRVRAGDTSAWDDYARVARELLDIERQIHGSQQGYFTLFNEVKSLTQTALDASSATSSIDPAILARETPFSSANDNQQPVVDGLSDLGAKLDAANENLGMLISLSQANGSVLPKGLGDSTWF